MFADLWSLALSNSSIHAKLVSSHTSSSVAFCSARPAHAVLRRPLLDTCFYTDNPKQAVGTFLHDPAPKHGSGQEDATGPTYRRWDALVQAV